jgi:hypothetical protein
MGNRYLSNWAVRLCQTVNSRNGDVAQLVERLLCKQEVDGSIPFISTSTWTLASAGVLCFRRSVQATVAVTALADSALRSSRAATQPAVPPKMIVTGTRR